MLELQILRGAVLTAQRAFEEAVAFLRDGLTHPRAIRLRHYGLARLAESLSRRGEHDEALAAVREGLEHQERTGQRRWEAELHRLKGIALTGLNRVAEAQTAFEDALRTADNRLRPMNCAPRRASRGPTPSLTPSYPIDVTV